VSIGQEAGHYVIVGGGPAAAAAVETLLGGPSGGQITLITEEEIPPYDRTTLSKAVLCGAEYAPPQLLDHVNDLERVRLLLGSKVTGVDTDGQKITTAAGEVVSFSKLLLATGAEPRRLTLPGSTAQGIHYLRDMADAREIKASLDASYNVVIIGGGVIGLEVAASSRGLGHDVTVIEVGPRILGRNVPEAVAEAIADEHRSHGVRILTSIAPIEYTVEDDHVTGVRLNSGETLAADIVVVGIGVSPRDSLASEAGLLVDDGILVDAQGQTSNPHVYAAGDAVRMRLLPEQEHRGHRLECWKAAGEQGAVAAANMIGTASSYTSQPWNWSDQYDLSMQSTGHVGPNAEELVFGGLDQAGGLFVLNIEDGKIVGGCGVSHGGSVAKAIRATQRVLESDASVLDATVLREIGGDIKALTKLMTSLARGMAPVA
jgi:3-phenylpropionate/trans-cinnamate dioxygenase ferredoxin reductase subunit